MLSLETARISSVRSGIMKEQLLEVSSRSKLAPSITGGSLSVTLTINEQFEMLPDSSITVQVTVVVPSPNICPLSVVLGAVKVVL